MADTTTGKTIDLTPTDEGFVSIALAFAASIRSDVKAKRRNNTPALMFGLCDIVRYLAAMSAMDPLDTEKRARIDTLLAAVKDGRR